MSMQLLTIMQFSGYCSMLPQEFGMVFILPLIYFLYRFFKTRKRKKMLKQPVPDIGDASGGIRKKYNYKDIKGKIIIEIEIFEEKGTMACYNGSNYLDDSTVLLEIEGIDGRAISDSLELCKEIKEVYKFYNNNTDITYFMKRGEEERPWEKVLDEINEGKLF
ncbi:MAG: hypothetical protein OSJ45_03700 [Lachnospiraceae bacterium]|nr:hypothetical protein [Lachnospiraceae bacterium]